MASEEQSWHVSPRLNPRAKRTPVQDVVRSKFWGGAGKPAPGFVDADLGQIRNALPGEYTKIGATLLGITTITLDGHQALKTTANLPVNTDLGNTLVASQTQYVLGANDFIYIITMTGTSPDLPTIAATFQTN